jgi:hypothetical protein
MARHPSPARLSAGALLRPSRVVGAALAALAILAAGTPAATTAQAPARVPRVGFLIPTAFPLDPEGPIEWLKQLGYLERRNIAFESRVAAGQDERLPELARELVGSRVDVIVTGGTPAIRAARDATRTIPIVMIAHGDPVRAGFIANLARPGGNVTGITVLTSEIAAKRLELPGIGGLMVTLDRLTMSNSKPIADLAAKHRLPPCTLAGSSSTGWGEPASCRTAPARSTSLGASRVTSTGSCKEAAPPPSPVEEPHEFELVINATTATALGLTIPESIRLRASVVVE